MKRDPLDLSFLSQVIPWNKSNTDENFIYQVPYYKQPEVWFLSIQKYFLSKHIFLLIYYSIFPIFYTVEEDFGVL